jgi:hypothetical protein
MSGERAKIIDACGTIPYGPCVVVVTKIGRDESQLTRRLVLSLGGGICLNRSFIGCGALCRRERDCSH